MFVQQQQEDVCTLGVFSHHPSTCASVVLVWAFAIVSCVHKHILVPKSVLKAYTLQKFYKSFIVTVMQLLIRISTVSRWHSC